jgi:hypothetical protein
MEQQIAFFNNVNQIIYVYPLYENRVQINFLKDYQYDFLNNEKLVIEKENSLKEINIENRNTYNRFQVNKKYMF